jgi:pyruvate formate-lyase activating enzyme-like uncharacterized protein
MLEEIRLTQATGCGITGGDPLVSLQRTIEYIKFLKEKCGKGFHIHLYTPFQLVSEKSMKALYEAGLDEIRFHPNVDDDSEWDRIKFAEKYDWDRGIEIPCLPDKVEGMKKIVDYFKSKVKFINLNELEFSDTTVAHYNMDRYETKDETSYGSKGSKEAAKEIINYVRENSIHITVYFCSAHLKDRIQMGNRIKRRAENVSKDYDEVTDEGMLVRGAVYLNAPKKRVELLAIQKEVKEDIIKKLEAAREKILSECDDVTIDIDKDKLRLLTYPAFVEHFAEKLKSLNFVPAIVEEYPTKDATEIEMDFL